MRFDVTLADGAEVVMVIVLPILAAVPLSLSAKCKCGDLASARYRFGWSWRASTLLMILIWIEVSDVLTLSRTCRACPHWKSMRDKSDTLDGHTMITMSDHLSLDFTAARHTC